MQRYIQLGKFATNADGREAAPILEGRRVVAIVTRHLSLGSAFYVTTAGGKEMYRGESLGRAVDCMRET